MRTGGRLGLGVFVSMGAVSAVGGWAGYHSRYFSRAKALGGGQGHQYKGNNQGTMNTAVMPMIRVRGKPMRTKSIKP